MEGTVDVVLTVVEKVGKNVVDVARDDELIDRKPHSFGVIPGKDIAEISCRHHEIDGFVLVYLPRSEKVEIGGNVINYLRHEPSPIDGVGGGEGISELLEAGFRLLARENAFDGGLRVVEIPFDAYYVDVLAFGGLHLQFLHRADAFGRIDDHYLGALDVLEAFERGFSGVARRRHENERFIGRTALFAGGGHKVRKKRERDVLERERGSVEKLQYVGFVVRTYHGSGFSVEARVRFTRIVEKLRFGIIGKIHAEYARRALGIIHGYHIEQFFLA